MAEILSTPFGRGLAVTVDHDPRLVATNAPTGSCILFDNGTDPPETFLKLDNGSSINVLKVAEMKPDGSLKVTGTAVSGDLGKAIVDVDDVKLATVAGYLKVDVTDEGSQIADQGYFIPLYILA